MRKNLHKRLLGGLSAMTLALSAFGGWPTVTASAATSWKFDFGAGGVTSGYTGVSASDGYSASRGYGFAQTGNVSNENAGGSGAGSDAVAFKSDDASNTFNVDLPKGLYQVKVTVGNAPRCSIKMEGMLQIMNLTRLNATETIQIPVTDGQLNIQAVTGIANGQRSISAIEITQLNTTGTTRPTVWICGDSTVANYYNQADTAQHGWGQYLNEYINMGVFDVRNMATSGQYAKGFVSGGQFDAIKTYGKAGDYYIISIGINDMNYSSAEEYYSVVTDMVKTAKGKGMNVILVKQQGRLGDLTRSPRLEGRWFGGQLDKIGQEQNVTVIDDFKAWQDFGLSMGADAMKAYYAFDDDLHQSLLGAKKNAELIAGLMKIGNTEMDTSAYYTFKNTASGMVMDVKDGKMEEGANLQQWGSNDLSCQKWKLEAFSGGTTYYYIRSAADPNYVLKAMTGSDAGNIELVPYSSKDSMMLFQFTQVGDGSYYISTRSSRDACFVEVAGASNASGANVQQYSFTYNLCQNWQALKVAAPETVEPDPDPDPEENLMLGDLDGSSDITAKDLSLLKNGLFEDVLSAAQKKAADVTGDGAVNASDAKLMMDFLLGKDVAFTQYQQKVYLAVDQTWEEGVSETSNAGFTDERGYVNLDNNDTSNITFSVDVPQDGNYLMNIRFANGSADDRQMKVFVNGNTNEFWLQSFNGTGAWTDWKEIGLVLPLKAGANTIKFLSALAGKGGPNLDYITLELTDEPYGETWDPDSYQQLIDDKKPMLYIAGDSTVQSYRAQYAPQQGWGYYLANYFGEGLGGVSNQAIAGRSSKSFYDQGRFNTIADSLKAGDFVMIQFAINDAGASNAERYAPVCGNVNNPTAGSYEWYMTQFINATLAKGATPILVTTVIGMGAWNSSQNKFVNSYSTYCDACKSLASKYSIPCIDLNSLMVAHYNSVGYNTARSYHLIGVVEGSTDGTHFCETGANIVAGIVAKAVKDQKIAGLADLVK